MFKRKTDSEVEEPDKKRSKRSDGSGSEESEEEPAEDGSTQPNVSPSKSLLGKLMSWVSPKATEKGDCPEGKSQSSSIRNSLSPQSPRKASSIITNSKGVVVLEGKIKLRNPWQDDLLEVSSDGYKTMAQSVVKLMDDVLHNSNVSKVYMNSVVVKFSNIQPNARPTRNSPGTVCVEAEMTFHHTYTKLFSDLGELCDNVEDFILLQSSLGEVDDGDIQIAEGADSVIVTDKKDVNSERNEVEESSSRNEQRGDSQDSKDSQGKHDDDEFEDAEDSVTDMLNGDTDSLTGAGEHQSGEGVLETPVMEESIKESPKTETAVPAEGNTIVVGKVVIPYDISDIQDKNVNTGKKTGSDKTTSAKGGKSRNKAGISTSLHDDGPSAGTSTSQHDDGPSVSGLQSTRKAAPGKSLSKHAGKSPTKHAGKSPSKHAGKSPSKHTESDPGKSPSKHTESDPDADSIPSEPGVPMAVTITSNSVILQWDRPKTGAKSLDHYEIKYKECMKRGKWMSVLSEGPEKTVKVKDLKTEAQYEFKVRAVNGDGEEGPFCQPSIKISTKSSLAKALIPMADIIEDSCPKIYKLPLTKDVETVNKNAKTRKCVFGKVPDSGTSKEKTIMVIGATGSGKTTLVDGMINYITDVSWEDDYRFSLVDLTEDEKKRKASEAESQTEWITCYTIHKMEGSTIDYTLNIIDTPGFGDTRGIARDKRIVDQIREFFTTPGKQGITCIDAVCFVTQAPLGKLTPPQRYIFDQILSVFGQDIASNIFVLITFADANEPPVRAALKAADVPYQKSFKFNNSALYASPENPAEAEMGNLFWRMGRDNFKVFFDELRSVESKSLILTSEVLQLRKRLETTIQGLQEQIAVGMNKLNTIKQEREILKRHKADIKAKKDFTYQVDEIHMYQIDLEPGVYVTNCMACNRTCHYPCGIPDDIKKESCAAMDRGQCTVCPMHCHWKLHKNNPFRFDTYTMKVTKTYEELKQKYEVAQKEAQKHKCVLGKVKTAFTTLGKDVMTMVHDVRCYINKLNDIALRPNPLSDKDYIDLLIESEKSEKKYGWEQRIKLFVKLRDEAELMEKMHQQNYQPWTYIDSEDSNDDDDDHTSSQDAEDDITSTEDEAIIDLPLDPQMEVE